MITTLMRKNKVVLLRGAAKRGVRPFIKQVSLIAMDTLVRKKHLVFKASAADVKATTTYGDSDLQLREITSWESLMRVVEQQPHAPPSTFDLGKKEWFVNGWRLWIGEAEGRFTCLGWLRPAEHSKDFFCAMEEDAELLWHSSVLPEFRQHNFHVLLVVNTMRLRVEDGVSGFYINCRAYNIPSERNIAKMGFKPVGYCLESRLTKRRTWHSVGK